MRFLADMGISQGIVAWLQAQGHDTMHLRDQRLQRLAGETCRCIKSGCCLSA
jgi:predicted nuclease of predicted toxin-antitoxin system